MLLLFLCTTANSAKILALFPFPGKSHSIMLNRLLAHLLDRGHELDVVSGFPLNIVSPNFTSIEITPHFDFWSLAKREIDLPGIFEMFDMSYETSAKLHYVIGHSTTDYALKHPRMQQLIHSKTPKQYDVILVEQFYQEAFLMLAHQLGAPVVSISTFNFASYISDMFGSFGAWSHVPHEFIVLPERMTFWQRVRNVHRHLADKYNRKYNYLAVQQRMADEYFAHIPG